jgi:Histidine kinase-, DNA gyrase B-, and HSP90-like ATPase
MREVQLPPFAPAMLDSMRAIGYSFDAALADIIDNSIGASASHVDVQFRTSPTPYVAIIDDGEGMTADGLLEAMRHGGTAPGRPRADRDLGRFSLGLKTASLSQCRRLTVITRRDGETCAARWDLDLVVARENWIVGVLDAEEIESLPHAHELDGRPAGTVVLWQDFDRALAGEASPAEALGRLVDDARDHLALAFHRFLTGDDGGFTVDIAINALPLPKLDPFLSSKRSTKRLPTETLEVEGATVTFRPFILPHITKMSRDDLELAGGEEGLRRHQGFYVYRGRRLITHGTWFRLIRQGELTKLARVQVDIPNSLDHLWALDVKKSTAYPPEAVRAGLLRTIDRIAGESRSVYVFRGNRARQRDIVHIWERVDQREGFDYKLNREHPILLDAMRDAATASRLEPLLRSIEMSLPVDSIFADMASDRIVQSRPPDADVEATLEKLAGELIAAVAVNKDARTRLLNGGLLALDVFAAHPEVTRRIVERYRHDG